jgi:hypothetical protein
MMGPRDHGSMLQRMSLKRKFSRRGCAKRSPLALVLSTLAAVIVSLVFAAAWWHRCAP